MDDSQAVAAENGHIEAELVRLLADKRGLGVVAGHEDGLGIVGLDRGELRVEVLVAFGIFFLEGADDAAVRRKRFDKIFCEADAVGGRNGSEHGDAAGVQRVPGEFGEDLALEWIGKADAENVTADFGDLRVGRGGRNHRDVRVLADGGGLDGAAGSDFAEDGDGLVAGDELAHGGGSLAGFGLVVLGDQLEFLAEHAGGGVDLLDREEGALVRGLAEGGFLAGERGILADLDGVVGAGGEHEQGGEGGNGKLFKQGGNHGVTAVSIHDSRRHAPAMAGGQSTILRKRVPNMQTQEEAVALKAAVDFAKSYCMARRAVSPHKLSWGGV